MSITVSQITKIHIPKRNPWHSPVNVIVEGKKGSGKIIIESDGDAWSYYWCNIGDDNIIEFFVGCDSDYLAKKFEMGISRTVVDESAEAIVGHLKSRIINDRLQGEITREKARELWSMIRVSEDGVERNIDLISQIVGNDWYNDLPKKPNDDYNDLVMIINVARSGLKEYLEIL